MDIIKIASRGNESFSETKINEIAEIMNEGFNITPVLDMSKARQLYNNDEVTNESKTKMFNQLNGKVTDTLVDGPFSKHGKNTKHTEKQKSQKKHEKP